MVSKVFAIICLTAVVAVASGQRHACEKKRMDYFRCEKKIESDDSLPTLCDKIDAILARCFDVYNDCTDAKTLEKSKEEYIMELVDTPVGDKVWQQLKKCSLIQNRLVTPKCNYETVLMNKYYHKECIERDKEAIFKPLMSSEDLQKAVCESFNRVAVGECAQYHWLCHDQTSEEQSYVQGWLTYWDSKLAGYEPVSINKCHGYEYMAEGTVRMFYGGKK
jgi:hypothetical protein